MSILRKLRQVLSEEEAKAIETLIQARAFALELSVESFLEKYPLEFEKSFEKSDKLFSIDEWKQERDLWHKNSHSLTKNNDGTPKVFYHGTSAEFDEFDLSMVGSATDSGVWGKGFYFGSEPNIANFYSKNKDGSNVLPIYLVITNPFILTKESKKTVIETISKENDDVFENTFAYSNRLREGLIKRGYDGVIDLIGDHNVAFHPNQIKSIFNRGTFDPENNSILYQAAYHGTPHEVDKFTTAKIGTGAGDQSFGYGLYFASSKEVAEYYKKDLSGADKIAVNGVLLKNQYGTEANIIRLILKNIKNNKMNFEEAKNAAIYDLKITKDPSDLEFAKQLENIKETDISQLSSGSLYVVDLKPEEHEYLRWDDKPNKKVIAKIVKSLNAQGIDSFLCANTIRFEKDKKQYSFDLYNGCTVYQGIAQVFDWNEKRASEFLHSIGIKGIKYLDGSSRQQGEGNYNYVIFHDDDVEIVERLNQCSVGSTLPKALIEFCIKPGETFAVIKLFKEADVSSLPHELAHYFRRTLDPELLDHAEEVFEVKNHKWDIKQEEAFALGFVKYLATCNAPTEKLEEVFAQYGEWMKKLWDTIQNSPEANFELSKEHEDFYAKLFINSQQDTAQKIANLLSESAHSLIVS